MAGIWTIGFQFGRGKLLASHVYKEGLELDHRAAYRWCYAKSLAHIDIAVRNTRNDPAEFNYDLSRQLNPDHTRHVCLLTQIPYPVIF